MFTSANCIGVLGGLGPYAGLDLVHKIFDCTNAKIDQEHLPVLLYSFPNDIPPRVEFLLGKTDINPGYAMGELMVRLAQAGASVIGMPCNTAHSAPMLDVALDILYKSGFKGQFVHMIVETAKYINAVYPHVKNVGVLCTQGAYTSKVFDMHFNKYGLNVLYLDDDGRKVLQNSISSPSYGIKAFSSPVTDKVKTDVELEAEYLAQHKADLILLGCTELPLALCGADFHGIPLLDPTRVLAESLIKAFDPTKLKK